MKHAAIVLAAGASSRMGQPKALLNTPEGLPLAQHQVELLRKAGCDKVMVVLGSHAEQIGEGLAELDTVVNTQWETGRLSSVLKGLEAVSPFDGCFVLPVDTAGIKQDTIQRMISAAEDTQPSAIRPIHDDKEGKIVWLSQSFALELLDKDPDPADERLDDLLRAVAFKVYVDDPAVLNNVNTPEEWAQVRGNL